jgi:hypothetical protein
MGRPVGSGKWDPDLERKVLEGIESGLTLTQVADKNSISVALILKYAAKDEIFREKYAHVMELRTDQDFAGLEDELQEAPRMVETKFGNAVDAGWVAWKRLQIDTRKWALSKRNPKKYGEKVAHTGSDGDGPVELVVKHISSDGE